MTSTRRRLLTSAAAAAAGSLLLPALLLAAAAPAHAAPTGSLTLSVASPLSPSGWNTGPDGTLVGWQTTTPDGAEFERLEFSYGTTVGVALTADGLLGVPDEGVTTVEAVAVFSDGSTASSSIEVRRDTSAPTVTVTTVPTGTVDHGIEVTLDFACADPESGVVSCLLQGRPSGSTVLLWESGNISWTLEAVNGAGVTTSVPVDFTVRPDVTGPGLREDVGGDLVNGWYTGPVTVIMSTWDPSGTRGIWSSTDGAPAVNSGSALANAIFTTDGAHVVEYWAFDPFGNRSVTRSVPVRIDSTAPRVVLGANDLELVRGESVVLDAACADDVAGVATSGIASCEAVLDGAVSLAVGDPLPTSTLGRHEVVLTATDVAGHRSAPVTLAYTVVAAADPTTPTSPTAAPGALASTGVEPALPAALALGAVALGAGMLGLRRRSVA